MRERQPIRGPAHGVCIFSSLGIGQIPIEKAAYKPFRVLLQNELEQTAIPGIFAGVAKDPPHSVSLFIPTNVGIHGGEGEIRTLETLLTPTRFPVARPRPN